MVDGRLLAALARPRTTRSGGTPHAVVARVGAASLRHFPATGAVHTLFVCMPLINTWTVFDLMPGHSVVESLVARGVSVYLLDWGRPGPQDRERSLGHFVDGVLGRMLAAACRHAAVQQMDCLGYCVGGTFLAMHAARHPQRVSRLALLCAPIDFAASGRLAAWTRPEHFPLDAIVDAYGNFPASWMKASFLWLRPQGSIGKLRALRERAGDVEAVDLWHALEAWNRDAVDFPGRAYQEYVRRCYFDNALIAGGWTLDATPVDLGAAAMPVLAIAASDDHICPPGAAFGLARAWGGPVTTRTIRGGHVAICAGAALPAALREWLG
jgi:polyhydroxyalkanoate synthase